MLDDSRIWNLRFEAFEKLSDAVVSATCLAICSAGEGFSVAYDNRLAGVVCAVGILSAGHGVINNGRQSFRAWRELSALQNESATES